MKKYFFLIFSIVICHQMMGQFQPNNVTYTGNDLNEAVNNALRDWETQYMVSQNYLGSVNVDLNITDNEELFLQMHNQIRLAINGKTLGSTTFNTPQLIGKEPIIKNFLINWKEPRRLQHINGGCDYNVHFMDTAVNFACSHPIIGPIYQWKKYGITNASTIFDGESNVETGGSGDQEEDFRFATELAIYSFWFNDASASWGHLLHMIRPTTQKMALHVFYKTNPLIALYYESTKGIPTLPLELLTFQPTIISRAAIQLQWQTANEVGTDPMLLYSSRDGVEWEMIYATNCKGNRAGSYYTYLDENLSDGIYYYKLETNGKSWIRTVKLGSVVAPVALYPNPTDGIVHLSEPQSTLSLYNPIGQLIANYETTNEIDLSQLPKGIYYLELESGERKMVVKK